MIEAAYKKKGIWIDQVWFASKEDKEQEKADIVFFHGMSEASTGKNSVSVPFHTLITDLTVSTEEMHSSINKTVQYQIRRNAKDSVTCKVFTSQEMLLNHLVIEQLADLYEIMYREKGNKKSLNMRQIQAYLKRDSIVLTGVFEEDKPLVFHSYIVGEDQVRLLHSVSDFRSESADASLIARANKRLHWEDICMFKNQGKKIYDWGGISSLDNPNGIDEFKLKFGGSPLTYYNIYKGASLLGKIAITLFRWNNRI